MAWTNIFPRIALTTYFQRYQHLISFKRAWKIFFKWWHQQITLQTNTNKYKTNIQQIPHHNSDSFQNTSNISKYLQSNVCKYISNVSKLTSRQIYLFFQDIWIISIISKSTSCKTYIKRLQIDCLRIAREWSWVSWEAKKWLKAPKEAALHSTSPSWLIIGDHKYTIKKDTFKRKAGSF